MARRVHGGQAVSAALPVTLTDSGHQALPARASYVSERTRQAAVLTDESCYPVTARCAACGGPIRLAAFLQMEWAHVAEAAQGAPGNPARGEPGAGEYPPVPGGPGTTTGGEG